MTGFCHLICFHLQFSITFPSHSHSPHLTASRLPRAAGPLRPAAPSTFARSLEGFCCRQNSQRQQCFDQRETVFTLSGFPIMWCAAFSRNTIAPKYRNCLDAPSSQHNDSTATGPGLERGPNALKCRDTLSTEVKEAASRDCQLPRGSERGRQLFTYSPFFCYFV